MRILGLDYGEKYVGVALSDELQIIASPFETIYRKEENKLRKTYARIEQIVEEYEVDKIVIGLPKNMNDTEGASANKAKAFATDVERRTGKPIILWDERLSTLSAKNILMESGVRRENRKEVLDQVAASIILQSYLDYQKNNQ